MKISHHIKEDLLGGITTSVVALPMAIAFGVVAFVPLGEAYVAQGVLAGLYGVIVAGILTSLFGGTPGQISLPTAPMAVMVTSIMTTLLKDPEISGLGENQIGIILMLVSMTIVMAGLIQMVMAALGGGKLIKFIPYPVIAGFMNGIALIIFLEQLQPLLGMQHGVSVLRIFQEPSLVHYQTVLVGAVTMLGMVFAKRYMKRIPAPLIGLVCGVAAYFIIGILFDDALLSSEGNHFIIGPIPRVVPVPRQVVHFFKLSTQIPFHKLGVLIVPALTLSILASTETLLTSVVSDMVTKSKHDSNRELLGQGIGNIASAAFGGLPISGSPPATMVNLNNGGRTAVSGIVSSLIVLIMVLLLGSLVQWIPIAVLAGILIVTSVTMIEAESIHISLKKSALGNLVVILAVTAVAVAVDLVIAVITGLIITAFLFIKEQVGISIIRKKYTGDLIRSKKLRDQASEQILDEKGDSIKIYQLRGSIFFGTCDRLLTEVEKESNGYIYILDFKRVHTIDLTGAQLLKQLVEHIHGMDQILLVSYLNIPADREKHRMRRLMEDVGLIRAIGADCFFPDTDRAQEWAEETLLRKEQGEVRQGDKSIHLKQMGLFRDMEADEVEVLRTYLHPTHYKQGDIIFEEGEPGDKIYFIMRGEVTVLKRFTTGKHSRRLATFGSGLFFGEMAILEGKPRSATVQAETDTDVFFMRVADFNTIVARQPIIASKILLGMAREMSYRLRQTSIEVRVLEE